MRRPFPPAACTPPDATRLETASTGGFAPYSHSIINEPSKLLICNAPEAAPPKFTVIFTVKVRSTSIGAGLQAIRSEVTFRDLSTSIDSNDDSRGRRRASAPVREAPEKGRRQTP